MTNQNIARIENLISQHITNLEANGLLSWSDKVCVAEIISHLANSTAALKFTLGGEDVEGWRE